MQTLLHFAGKNEVTLQGLFQKIDALPEADSQEIARVQALLEERLGELIERIPSEKAIVQAWKDATTKEPHEPDLKWKLKIKLPFVIGELERELSWDGKAMLKMLSTEIMAFARGEKTLRELFLE